MDELLKNLGIKLDNIKTKALHFNSNIRPKVAAGYKLKPLPSKPKHGTGTPKTSKMPGSGPRSKKNPMKQAQQVKDKGQRREAKIQAKSLVKYLPNGQWTLIKAQ